jgi:lipopolysaccharide/colanic/teichoic acid biosynthesis glycosyltransferase
LKRIFDIIISFFVLLFFFPFGLIISLLIIFSSKGGVFYKQKRVGKNGVSFNLLKFRSMKPDSDKLGQLTIGMKDPRITKIGLFLRKSKLDEFPQFINVLFGEMSIVGPRPEVQEYVDMYTDEQRKILDVQPGITDYASLEYFDENRLLGESENPRETYIHEIMPHKIKLNEKYLENPSLSQDLKIIFQTAKKMIKA